MAKPARIVGRIAKWGLLSLVALVACVVLLATFMDWNRLKPYIESLVSERTGREFAIAGDLNVDVWAWRPHLRAERIRFENARWGHPRRMMRLRAFDVSIDLVQLIKGHLVIPQLIIDEPVVHLARSKQGRGNWQLKSSDAVEETPETTAESGESQAPTELPAILKLVVRDGRGTYHDPAAKQEALRLTIANISGSTRGPGGKLTLDGHGRLQHEPWRLDFKAGALEKLLASNAPYPVNLKFDMGRTRARINGALEDPAQFAGGKVDFALRGPGLEMLSAFLDPEEPRLPPYNVEGRVSRTGQTWRVRKFQAKVGNSDLRGELAFDTGGKRPMLKADLSARRLDYADFAGLTPPSKPEKPKPLDLSALKTLDAIVNVRGDEILTPTVVLRDARAAIRLEDGRLRVQRLKVDVGGGSVRAQASVDANAQPFQASLQTVVRRVNFRKLGRNAQTAQGLAGIVDGRVKVSVTGASKAQIAEHQQVRALSLIDSLVIEDSAVQYALPGRRTRLEVTADTVTAVRRRQLAIRGNGRYRGEPFELAIRSDPLLELANTATDKPYAISGKVSGANTEIAFKGALRQPLAFQGVDVSLSVKGDGTDRLAAALDRPLPNLPAYKLRGRLRRQDATWKINDFDGRIGESDLTGDIAIGTGDQRPIIKAELVSRRLDHADFAAVLGAEPDGQETAQEAEEPTKPAADRPAEPPFDLAPLQRFNADISFEGKEIIAPNLPLKDLAIDLAVRDGQLAIGPFALGIGGGTIKGALSVDGATPIRGNLTTTIDQVDVQQIVEPFDLKSTFGVLDGHAEIAIVGATEAQIAAAEQTALTFIHSLVIEDTRFAYVDSNSGIDIDLSMRTTETANGGEPITIDGRAAIRARHSV